MNTKTDRARLDTSGDGPGGQCPANAPQSSPTTPVTRGTPEYRPDSIIGIVREFLTAQGAPPSDEPKTHEAYLAAASLLRALGVTPLVDADDHSRAAETVRMLLAEDATRTTTRARRAVLAPASRTDVRT